MSNDRFARLVTWLTRAKNHESAEERFNNELGVTFGVFQSLAVAVLGLVELIWGTSAVGIIFLASVLPMMLIVYSMRSGVRGSSASIALLAVLFAVATIINLGTGGRVLGVNVALPTLALFAVLLSPSRMALLWIVLIVVQIFCVSRLRYLQIDFPMKPNVQWVSSAIDRVPLVLSLASAAVGWLIRNALLHYRTQLDIARDAERLAKAEARQQADRANNFAEIAADGFWETDTDLKLTYVSPGLARMIGLEVSELLGLTPAEAYLKRFPDTKFDDGYMRPLNQREVYVDQLLGGLDAKGQPIWARSEGHPLYDEAGQFIGYRGAVHDVTLEYKATQALRDNEQRLRLITDNLPALISYIDAEGVFRFNNLTYAHWLKRPLEEITGQPLAEVFSAETYALIEPQLMRALAGERIEFDLPPSDTRDRHIHVIYVPDLDDHGQVRGVYGLIHDVTEVRQAEAELKMLAEFDPLTGLPNRRRLMECIDQARARSDRHQQSMALLYLDLDRFKSINDSLGHQTGDLVLQEFARRLGASVRETDTVARLAGDEFVIVLEDLQGADEAQLVAGKILQAMLPTFEIPGHSLAVSTSIGIAIRREDEEDAGALLHRADAALYGAKSAGRGGYLVAI